MNKKQMGLVAVAITVCGVIFGSIMWVTSTARPPFLVSVIAGILTVYIVLGLIVGCILVLLFFGYIYERLGDREDVFG